MCTLWVAEDETKSLQIDAYEDAFRVTVWNGYGPKTYVREVPAQWYPAKAGTLARDRLGYLQVELGDAGLGTTYDLMLGWPNPTGEGYAWIKAPQDAKLEDLRLFPEGGPSFYEAVLGVWDDTVEEMNAVEQGWIEPLSTYRIASATQRSRHQG